jgi:hypothetical protein
LDTTSYSYEYQTAGEQVISEQNSKEEEERNMAVRNESTEIH